MIELAQRMSQIFWYVKPNHLKVIMNLISEIRAAKNDPQKLEKLYQAAQQTGRLADFQSALLACYQEMPDNLLYAAWFYRLQNPVRLGFSNFRFNFINLSAFHSKQVGSSLRNPTCGPQPNSAESAYREPFDSDNDADAERTRERWSP
jgi:hypothetical protein